MDESEIDIRGILSLLRRRLRMIVLTLVAVLGVAILALVAMTPIYTATTLILVDPSRKNLLESELGATTSSADSARVDSEVEIMRSNAVLLSVVRDHNLIDDPEFGVSPGLMDRVRAFFRVSQDDAVEDPLKEVLDNFSAAVSVQRRGLTYVIAASVRSEDPERAAQLANGLAHAYIAEQLRAKVASIGASQAIIATSLEQTGNALVETERAFDDFITANVERLAGQAGYADIQALRDQLQDLTSRREQITTVADTVERSLEQQDWSGLVAALQSEALDTLNAERLALRDRLEDTGAQSAAAIDLRQQLEAIEERLAIEASAQLEDLSASLPELQSQADSIRQELRTTLLDANLPVDVLTRLYELQQSAELVRAQYQTLLARDSELQVQANLQVADSRVVAPALAPNDPSFPNSRLILVLAGLVGLGLGVGLAFLYENYLGGFTSEGQVGSVLKLPVLAEIPRQKGVDQSEGHSLADILVKTPLSIYAESIRRIRSGIDQVVRRKKLRPAPETGREGIVIMVSSTSPGEGKSTVSLSLGRAYALSGKRTVLIDGDMRKPSIHKHVGLEQTVGLVDYLLSEEQVANDVVRVDHLSGTNLILGSRAAEVPTDQLILSNSFARLVEACRKAFDIVIIDTPPVGPVVDAIHIAQFADVVLFVTRWSSTSQGEAKAALARLQEATEDHTPILAVLNQQEGFSARYYSRRYAGYYAEA